VEGQAFDTCYPLARIVRLVREHLHDSAGVHDEQEAAATAAVGADGSNGFQMEILCCNGLRQSQKKPFPKLEPVNEILMQTWRAPTGFMEDGSVCALISVMINTLRVNGREACIRLEDMKAYIKFKRTNSISNH
jgi:hypothetical protein